MSQVRILDYNFVFDSATDLTLSTEDSNFPVSNLKSFLRGDVRVQPLLLISFL